MQKNHTHQARNKRGHNGWKDWELVIMSQCCGQLTKEQIANMITFLGSKRSPTSIIRQANLLGRKLRIVR
jgi:hypothetical protein